MYEYSVVPVPSVENAIIFTLNGLDMIIISQSTKMRVYFWNLSFSPFIYPYAN